MSWDAIGAVAELLGSLAVIATLIFLVQQIRSNSVMIQNNTAQSAADAVAAPAFTCSTGTADLAKNAGNQRCGCLIKTSVLRVVVPPGSDKSTFWMPIFSVRLR